MGKQELRVVEKTTPPSRTHERTGTRRGEPKALPPAGRPRVGPAAPVRAGGTPDTGNMTRRQKQELLDLLALELSTSAKNAEDPDLGMWSVAVCSALEGAIGPEGGGNYGQVLVRRSLGTPAAWRPVGAFMESSGLLAEPKNIRQSVYLMLGRLLVDHALGISDHTGAPMGPKLVATCAANIRGVFERSFPGYLAAGLAPVVARPMATSLR